MGVIPPCSSPVNFGLLDPNWGGADKIQSNPKQSFPKTFFLNGSFFP